MPKRMMLHEKFESATASWESQIVFTSLLVNQAANYFYRLTPHKGTMVEGGAERSTP